MRRSMIWFDFGGVLSPPLSELFASYEARTGINRDMLETAMAAVADRLGMPSLAPVELALLTEEEWGSRLADELSRHYPGVDLSRCDFASFGAQWFDEVEPNHIMVNAVRYARENGYRVGILTNNVVEWEPHWTRIVAPAGEVDCVVDSCRVGVRKPDREIFRIAAKSARATPEDCVLVDDLAENCYAARTSGWQAVRFRTNRQALRELYSITGLPSIL
jgi:putative hydrolase of the HAD superfamily